MALPQKVIEQLGREPARTPGWSGQVLMFTSTLFFIALFVYAGIIFGYKPYLNASIKKLNDQINTFAQQIPQGQQKDIIHFYSQLANVKKILDGHIFTSPFFGWLEKNVNPNVYFTSVNITMSNHQVVLNGLGKTLDDVTAQLELFRQAPEVAKLAVGGVTVTSKGITFDTTLTFAPSFFKVQAPITPTQ